MTNNNELEFVTRQGHNQRTSNGMDVSLTILKNGRHIALSIARDACAMIGSGDYVTAARLGGRLYIKKADESNGFKLQGKAHSSRVYVQIPNAALRIREEWVGGYRLWWNSERELFYLDHERRY